MKALIRGLNLSLIFIISCMILGCVIQESRFSTDLKRIVSDSLVQTARVVVDERYDISNNSEFMAEFEQNLLRNITATPLMELDVYYLGADIENKVISVFVEQRMPFVFYPSREMKVNTQQSIIVDTTQINYQWVDVRYHNVSITELPSDTPYIHQVGKETVLPIPSRDGYKFQYWETIEGNRIDKISADYNKAIDLYAIWK